MVSSALGSMWYFESGASFHMMGDKELFSDLEEKDLQMHIEMGDDAQYNETNIGTITFQRDSSKPFQLKDVMHVPGLKKNLVSVAMLEDRGYDVVFSDGKVFLRHKTMGQAKRIGIQVNNIYKLEVYGCTVMNMGISLLTIRRRRRTRRLLELQLVRPLPHNFNLISL